MDRIAILFYKKLKDQNLFLDIKENYEKNNFGIVHHKIIKIQKKDFSYLMKLIITIGLKIKDYPKFKFKEIEKISYLKNIVKSLEKFIGYY